MKSNISDRVASSSQTRRREERGSSFSGSLGSSKISIIGLSNSSINLEDDGNSSDAGASDECGSHRILNHSSVDHNECGEDDEDSDLEYKIRFFF